MKVFEKPAGSEENISDKFIYGLIYAGFLGSMIYEIFPAYQEGVTLCKQLSGFYWSTDFLIKFLIIYLYCIDYLHLFGHIHKAVDSSERDWIYYTCDILTSLCFILAFTFFKYKTFAPPLLLLFIIPVFIGFYKRHNCYDFCYFLVFIIINLLIILSQLWFDFEMKSVLIFYLVWFTVSYSFYVFLFYPNCAIKQQKRYGSKDYQQFNIHDCECWKNIGEAVRRVWKR